ncbi:OLC1v1037750C1 [Oldenlandia corymbosa var. corymbosa]|uniref:OLC1v1037750C1 n=1 Tax=Oldenlandia corymbosa var. corymbosa TaxID=529605 RepID=A0AAV1D1X7_OLDCO|nr:OLC1v1037750C1 [Oldenlandia corymbosa var. corymbosa]
MADSRPSSDPERVHERTKEEFDDAQKNPFHHHKETHGLRSDIDEQTSISDVKAPNVFERAKEEFEAIVEAVHPKKEHDQAETHVTFPNGEKRNSAEKVETKEGSADLEKSKKSPNLIEKVKGDMDGLIHKKKHAHGHHKETHGTSNDIDESTPIDEVKGPNLFERAKEEVVALLDVIHPKKDTGSSSPSKKKEGGFRMSVGKGLEKICSPRSHNED